MSSLKKLLVDEKTINGASTVDNYINAGGSLGNITIRTNNVGLISQRVR